MIKKIFKNIFKWFFNLFIIFLVYLIISSFVSICSKKVPSVFNYNFFIIQTDSMSPTIQVDDLVISKKYDFYSLKADYDNDPNTADGDIITFLCVDSSSAVSGQIITHRIISIIDDENGNREIVTKGDNNTAKDVYKVTIDNYYGKVVSISSFTGKIVSFFYKTGIVIIIGIVCFVMCLTIFLQIKKEGNLKNENQNNIDYKEKLREEILEELKQEGFYKKKE